MYVYFDYRTVNQTAYTQDCLSLEYMCVHVYIFLAIFSWPWKCELVIVETKKF